MTTPVSAAAHEALVEAARRVSGHAHAPYSQFRVGAAVLASDGRVFAGCNVESATYGATLCAERAALAAMIAAGPRTASAVAIFVDAAAPAMPCGICRQWLAELAPGAVVIAATAQGRRVTTIDALLPEPFLLAPR